MHHELQWRTNKYSKKKSVQTLPNSISQVVGKLSYSRFIYEHSKVISAWDLPITYQYKFHKLCLVLVLGCANLASISKTLTRHPATHRCDLYGNIRMLKPNIVTQIGPYYRSVTDRLGFMTAIHFVNVTTTIHSSLFGFSWQIKCHSSCMF